MKGHEKRRVTPYMHMMVYHMHVWMLKYRSVKKFTGQAVEKKNDDVRKFHVNKSSHHDSSLEAMQACKRVSYLSNCEREKRRYSCPDPEERKPRKSRKTVGVEVRPDTVAKIKRHEELQQHSEIQLKKMLNEAGINTKVRSKPKLIDLLLEQ